MVINDMCNQITQVCSIDTVLIQHDITKTAIAILYTKKHAALKFEVVCFPSNELPRKWPETSLKG